jgi:hypothetical protein
VRKLRWLVAVTAIGVLVGGCAGTEVAADLADHAAPEIDATRIAEISPAETISIAVPSDTGIDPATAVSTTYGDIPPQDAAGLNQSAADEASAVSDATAAVATNPATGEVDSTIQDGLATCVKAGFISVGKTYFNQWLNGQDDFNALMSSAITACLTKTFPGVNQQLISQLSSKLVATIDPSAQQARQNSPTPGVFQNWLVQAGT